MPNYKEVSGTGQIWRRCHQATIYNQEGREKAIVFEEQDVAQIGDRKVSTRVGEVVAKFDPNGYLPLYDPETGDSLGKTITHKEIYTALYSLYLRTAQDRDLGRIREYTPGDMMNAPTGGE